MCLPLAVPDAFSVGLGPFRLEAGAIAELCTVSPSESLLLLALGSVSTSALVGVVK